MAGQQAKPSRASAAVALTAALLLANACAGQAQCTSNSAFVGFEGDLTEFEHDLSGRVRIIDDCTMEVTGFTYDGQGPDVFWWGAPSSDNAAIRSDGRRIVSEQITRAYNGETITVTLDEGLTWDMFPVVSVWCEDFTANFGHVELQAVREPVPEPASPSPFLSPEASSPSPESPSPSPESPSPDALAGAPAPAPATESTLGLANCIELLPGYYNLHWEVVDSQLVIGMEGRVGGDNHWLGFGFSAPDATDVTMPGSDAVVGGMIGGECFAFDYHLQTRLQCSYTERSGVCPDFGLSGDPATDQVELLGCTMEGEVMTITATRPLNATDEWDRPWPLDGTGFPIWAIGPVSEGSNAEEPVVLYHRLQLPGMAAEDTVHAPTGQNYRINLGQASPPSSCRPLVGGGGAAQPNGAPQPGVAPAPRTPVATIEGITTFDVTEGDNPNYPNPPGWGVSYHINGLESPVITAVRGTPYTFRVMAGPNHPMYLTSSIIGGGSFNAFEGEAIYGGGEEAQGTEEEPFELVWTPDATTPELLYYQCTIHQKLGWEIRVVDA